MSFSTDVAIIGGCGRIGLPLAIALADRGLSVCAVDVNEAAVRQVARGQMPFIESDAEAFLSRVVETGKLRCTTDSSAVRDAEHVIVTLATDVDLNLNPDTYGFLSALEAYAEHLVDGQLLILRSTLYPGTTAIVETLMKRLGKEIDIACCPERIAEGNAMTELFELPQLVGSSTETASNRAVALFSRLVPDVLPMRSEEAELAKLFSNTWRYTKFAVANQLFMMANDLGLDYEAIRQAMSFNYPRAADVPRSGFAAGPCLFKDTMQLAAFNNNNFTLGHASMLINEGLPLYLVSRLSRRYELENQTVGILGMAFKAESDDTRSSLSYKLKRVLQVRAARVLCTDPYVRTDPELVSLDIVLDQSDLLILGAPHQIYASLETDIPTVDIWNLFGRGVLV
jgi:UDP-N-acetyl-D-mannosaminuronic acid dehydrogenase